MEVQPKHIHAPAVYGDFWFNSEPISISELQGSSVILLDFWDCSSISSIRGLPYIKEWRRKYEDFGLVAIGVHTPEFKFARSQEVVQRALKDLGIQYPVVTDNEAIIWSAYGIRFWPTRVLIDLDGYIRVMQSGETGYQEFERAMQQLLAESGYRGEMPDLTKPFRDTDEPGAVLFQTTREIQLGYLKGTLGNPEGFSAESTADYVDKGLHLPERFYANGKWMSERDFLCYNGSLGEKGTIMFQYGAREVNAVMNSKKGSRFEIVVEQDDKALTERTAGLDVVLLPGKSVVYVDTPKMYRLVKNPEFQSHALKIIVSDPDLEIYTFSFVSSVIPDVIPSN